GEERQAGGKDEKTLLGGALPKAERAAKRGSLRQGEPIEVAQRRPNELVQGGERKLRLRLDATGFEDMQIDGSLAGVLEQSRLPNAGLPAHDQGAAPTRPSSLEERSDRGALRVPPVQHREIVILRIRARGSRAVPARAALEPLHLAVRPAGSPMRSGRVGGRLGAEGVRASCSSALPAERRCRPLSSKLARSAVTTVARPTRGSRRCTSRISGRSTPPS